MDLLEAEAGDGAGEGGLREGLKEKIAAVETVRVAEDGGGGCRCGRAVTVGWLALAGCCLAV